MTKQDLSVAGTQNPYHKCIAQMTQKKIEYIAPFLYVVAPWPSPAKRNENFRKASRSNYMNRRLT